MTGRLKDRVAIVVGAGSSGPGCGTNFDRLHKEMAASIGAAMLLIGCAVVTGAGAVLNGKCTMTGQSEQAEELEQSGKDALRDKGQKAQKSVRQAEAL